MHLEDFVLARIADDEATAQQRGPTIERRGYSADQILRDAQSKRRLVRLHGGHRDRCSVCFKHGATGELVQELSPCHTLRILGLAYADHPEYREQWRP